MRIECDIIRDLIPLYADGTLSDTSRKAVEEHVEECASCRDYLKEVQDACRGLDKGETMNDFRAEARTLKRARKSLRKKKVITIILSAVIAIVLVAAIAYGVISKMTATVVPISDTKNISVYYDDNGNLLADIKGPAISHSKIVNVTLDDNGKEVTCLVFGAETTRWDQVTAGDDAFARLVLAYGDKGSSEVDRVYYLVPDTEDADSQFGDISNADSVQDLGNAELVYEK